MNDKQLSVEDVIRQMHDTFTDPSKILINPTQMAVIRQMMDAGALSNHRPAGREIYEKEIPDEVPQVQRSDNGK